MKQIIIIIVLLSSLSVTTQSQNVPSIVGIQTHCLCPDGFISNPSDTGCVCIGHQVSHLQKDTIKMKTKKEEYCLECSREPFWIFISLIILIIGLGIALIKTN